MGVKGGEPCVRSARGRQASDTTERLINSEEEPEGKHPDTLTQAFTSMCAGTRVRDAALRGWTGRAGQGSTAPLMGLPGKSPASEGPEPLEGGARRPPGPPRARPLGVPTGRQSR